MKVTIVGVGGLGGALAEGLAGRVELTLCGRRPETTAGFVGRANLVPDPVAAVVNADVVVVCVKPKGMPALLTDIAPQTKPDALIVSCAAGVELRRLLASGRAIARAMPNIGAQVGASTTAFVLGAECVLARDRARILSVFSPLGEVHEAGDETWLHPITAVAASGPAFLLLAVEALVDGAVEQGLPRTQALVYARGALRAAALRLDPGLEPATLRSQVTSPAGTTAAGLARLEHASVRAAFLDAVRAATARSRDLSE